MSEGRQNLRDVRDVAESSTRTVDRALLLLGIVCNRGSVSLADAARDAELSASTALRLLRTLESSEFVRRDEANRYSPGPRIVQLGALALGNESLISLADGAMSRMVERTGESCYLSIRGAGETALYIAIVEGTHSVRHASWVGRTMPLKGTAAGTALTGDVESGGFAVNKQGLEVDVTAVAVPILAGKRVVAALSSVVPSYRIDDEQIEMFGELLAHEAKSIVVSSEALRWFEEGSA